LQVVKFVTDLKIYLEKNIYTQDLDDLFDKENIPNYINVNQFDSSECLMEWTMMFLQTVFNNIVNRDNTIKKVEVYLEENYHRDLSLTEIAETFHMNSVYFCQYFKKQKGVTFVHYLNQLRIEKAKQLLHSTDDTVEMIAEKVGIFNTNYFFRLFKKVTGITIGTFRKNR
jgi:two-component system, response regulator YesN